MIDRNFKIKEYIEGRSARMVLIREIGNSKKEEISFIKDIISGNLIVKRFNKAISIFNKKQENLESVLIHKSVIRYLSEFIDKEFSDK